MSRRQRHRRRALRARIRQRAGGAGEGNAEKSKASKPPGSGKSSTSPAPTAKKKRDDSETGPLLLASELEAAVATCQQKVDAEEDKLDPSKKSVSVLIGEGLTGVSVRQMVITWAKRGSEPLNKLEFRQHVRKLLANPDSRQIDALFESFDSDHSGFITYGETGAVASLGMGSAIVAPVD